MEKLLSSLKNIPEYQVLLKALSDKESAAVTGIGQINRSHLIAGLRSQTPVPMVVIVQDDIAAKRLQQELKDFLGETFPVLPHRESGGMSPEGRSFSGNRRLPLPPAQV